MIKCCVWTAEFIPMKTKYKNSSDIIERLWPKKNKFYSHKTAFSEAPTLRHDQIQWVGLMTNF